MTNLLIEFLASFLIWLVFASLLVLWLIDGRIKKEQVLHAVFAFALAWAIAEVIKRLFPTERPFVLNGGDFLTFTKETSGAFPSGHSSAAFALATTIWLHDRKVGWLYMILALVIGAARVLANVHYPQDILGGALLGIIVAFVIERLHLFAFLTRK